MLAGLCWSLAGVFIKSLALHPVVIAFYRALFAMLFFIPFAGTRRWRPRPRLLFSGLVFTAATSSLVWATKLTTAANAIVLQNTAPVFVCVLVYLLFRERPTRPNLVTLLFGMAGILIIFGGAAGAQDLLGVSVGLGSGFMLGVYFVNLRFLRGFDPFALMLANNLVATLALLGLAYGELSVSAAELAALGVSGGRPVRLRPLLFLQEHRAHPGTGGVADLPGGAGAQSALGGPVGRGVALAGHLHRRRDDPRRARVALRALRTLQYVIPDLIRHPGGRGDGPCATG